MKYNNERVKSAIGKYDDEKEHGINRRYLLKISLNKTYGDKSILFIMMNPAEANDDESDMTIQKVINYVYENRCNNSLLKECKEINIVNAYVVYTQNPKEVSNMINKYGEDYVCGNEDKNRSNDKTIKEQIEKNDVIIFACGKGDIYNYNNRIKEIKEILRKSNKIIYSVGTLTEDGYPRHMSRISYKLDLIEMKK